MGESKRKKAAGFPDDLINAWEARDCVDFAVALARATGWLLHVDWGADHGGMTHPNQPEAEMIPLRVYVGNDGDLIFDPRGIRRIAEFNTSIIGRLAQDRRPPTFKAFGVATRTYDEEKLATMPLRFQADEKLVAQAQAAIRRHSVYLTAIPKRAEPRLPAKVAADFSWGNCAIYAKALEDVTGQQATALCADELAPNWDSSNLPRDRYVHSLVVWPDGTGEDSWGRQTIINIAARFGVQAGHFDRSLHLMIVERLQKNSPDLWQQRYEQAYDIIKSFYGNRTS